MRKRGSISLSFGMIFSIIIIIAIIGVAFYAISYFLNLGKCTEISLFYQNFQKEVDKAWSSEITRESFIGNLPGGIKSVCFFDRDATGAIGVGEEYEALEDYFITRGNMFLYPPEDACNQVSKKAEHVDLSGLGGWHCFEVRDKKVRIPLEKGSFDALVRINKE